MRSTDTVLVLAACSAAIGSCPRPTFSWTMSSSSSSSNKSSKADNKNQWFPLDPDSSFSSPTIDGRRFAKDEQYLKAVLDDWRSTITTTTTKVGKKSVETCPYIYYCDNDDNDESPLYGHWIRPVHRTSSSSPSRAPGSILLFHTAAGPHDVFLFYKAHVLASQLGCQVLICDILSDENGWGWDPDRTRYNLAREQLLLEDNGRLLQSRVRAAIRAVQELDQNDDGDDDTNNRVVPLAALGWCLGAQPILELAQLEEVVTSSSSLVGLVTFHGVFRRPDTTISSTATTTKRKQPDAASTVRKILICNGSSDPFVSTNDVQSTQKGFEDLGYRVHVRQFEGAKHGFTNPAQAFNPNDAFDYNSVAATESWDAAMLLLKQQFNI